MDPFSKISKGTRRKIVEKKMKKKKVEALRFFSRRLLPFNKRSPEKKKLKRKRRKWIKFVHFVEELKEK